MPEDLQEFNISFNQITELKGLDALRLYKHLILTTTRSGIKDLCP
jgi:hypothetical protein